MTKPISGSARSERTVGETAGHPIAKLMWYGDRCRRRTMR